ncbi:MAG: hypothetical protein ACK4E0_03680 [Chitinophagaceae bacterium]
MKSDVMPSIVQMEAEELKTLLTEVKETVADIAQLSNNQPVKFSAVDMWNIRRGAKSATARMSR